MKKFQALLSLVLTVNCIDQISAHGLYAFDCIHENATGTPLNLIKPENCYPKQKYYRDPSTIRIQLIQTSAARPVTGYACRMTMSSEVTRCGFDSLTYGTHHPMIDQAVPITPVECRIAVKEKEITVARRTVPLK